MTIISGGQTGADQGGLRAGRALGLPTGGWAPRGWRTEAGVAAWLKDYGLVEHASAEYPPRTKANVHRADATLLVGDPASAGSAYTLRCCVEARRPCLIVPFPLGARSAAEEAARVRAWLGARRPEVLNVAGNRESENPGIGAFTTALLTRALLAEPAGPAEPAQEAP